MKRLLQKLLDAWPLCWKSNAERERSELAKRLGKEIIELKTAERLASAEMVIAVRDNVALRQAAQNGRRRAARVA